MAGGTVIMVTTLSAPVSGRAYVSAKSPRVLTPGSAPVLMLSGATL